jgi:long-chain acyl-CoA synthetase
LYLQGRENRMIVTSGKNVFPEQIEHVLSSHPQVRNCAVIAIPDRQRGERLIALIYPKDGCNLSASELMRYARLELPLPFVPRIYAQPRTWRWTASGKTDFAALKTDWLSGACELME